MCREVVPMIHSGNLDRQIIIERQTETVAASGAVSRAWVEIATVRAELVQQSTDKLLSGLGETATANLVFRIRYLADLTTADRVIYGGATHDIDAIAELGRKRGLELRVIGGAK